MQESSWDGAKSVQARVQDIELHQKQQVSLSKQLPAGPSNIAPAGGKPTAAVKQNTVPLQEGSTQQDLPTASNAQVEPADVTHTYYSKSAQQVKTAPADRVMTDDTAQINLGDSWAPGSTPFGTMEADEAGTMLAAAKQGQLKADGTWGILGLASGPHLINDARMKPLQMDDTIDTLEDPSGLPMSLGDTAYALVAAPALDTSLGDSHSSPITPMSTLADDNGQRDQGCTETRMTGGEDFEAAEPPGVRFREGEDSMIGDRSSIDHKSMATVHVAKSPRSSAAWQTQMGSVAGWQALASEVRHIAEFCKPR